VKTKGNPKVARRPATAQECTPIADTVAPFDGPHETIAASVPKTMAKTVREMVGARGFSKFVTDALAREVARRNREELIAVMEAESGPADPELVVRYRRLLSR
jgi:hypothetical protein